MTAEHEWLDMRVPFDDAARQQSLPLLDRVAAALRETSIGSPQPITIIDIGAGTGNSARWFRQHLTPRLSGQDLRWVLVDTDQAALDAARSLLPGVQTLLAEITQLPQIVDHLMASVPGRLLITGSAVLDVLTELDLEAIIATLDRHNGLAVLMLSITGQWRLTPTDAHDDVVNQAFSGHQQQRARLGPWAPATLQKLARQAGASVVTSVSQWNLMAPKHHVFLSRFLSERIQAAVEHEPEQAILANEWLQRRLEQATKELTVEVEHLDVLVDALGTPRHGRPTTCDG